MKIELRGGELDGQSFEMPIAPDRIEVPIPAEAPPCNPQINLAVYTKAETRLGTGLVIYEREK